MTTSSLNLANSQDPTLTELAELAADLRAAAPQLHFLLVGATARDLLLFHAFGIRTDRATEDIDLALAVAGQAERFYGETGLFDSAGSFGYEKAGAWLAGRGARAMLRQFSADPDPIEQTVLENAGTYFSQRGPRARRFLGSLIANPGIAKLMSDIEDTRRQRDQERHGNTRDAWDRLRRMESVKFARARCRNLRPDPSQGGLQGVQAQTRRGQR